jgi:type IV pilus assembly protein PilQ
MRRVWFSAAVAALLLSTTASADPIPARTAASVTGVDVRSAGGRAEVAIAVSEAVTVTDFQLAAPHRVVLDLEGATLGVPSRIYDGVARAGIRNVRVAQFRGDVVRIVLDLDEPRAYSLAQAGEAVLLSFEAPGHQPFAPWSLTAAGAAAPAPMPIATAPVVVEPAAPRALPTQATQSQERRITVAWRDADLRDVAQDFAVFAGRSIVINSGITAKITAEVTDQPWDVALNAILRAEGLAAVVGASGIITIDKYTNLQSQAATEPLSKQIVPLNYAKAEELVETIRALLSRECGGSISVVGGAPSGGGAASDAAGGTPAATAACAPRGSVVAERQANALIIFEVGSRIDELVEYAKSFDFKTQQVNIKAKIIAVDRTGTERLGVSYDLGTAGTFFNTLAPRLGPGGQQQGVPTEFQVALGGDAFAGIANASRTFSEGAALNLITSTTLGRFSISAFLDALSQEELSDIQAEPSVNTMDKRQAEIFVGNRVPYLLTPPTPPGQLIAVAPQLQIAEVGIKLTVTPSISANRTIRMTVQAEQSNLIAITAAGPNSAERRATTEVIVRDGETVVLGGLTQTQVTRIRRGIPFLYQLPFIGRIFSENESIERKQDLLILITPHILDDEEPPARDR